MDFELHRKTDRVGRHRKIGTKINKDNHMVGNSKQAQILTKKAHRRNCYEHRYDAPNIDGANDSNKVSDLTAEQLRSLSPLTNSHSRALTRSCMLECVDRITRNDVGSFADDLDANSTEKIASDDPSPQVLIPLSNARNLSSFNEIRQRALGQKSRSKIATTAFDRFNDLKSAVLPESVEWAGLTKES